MTEAFVSLALVWLLAAMTPGPNFFAVMHMAAGYGRAAAIAASLGTVVGTGLWASAGFFGLKALFAALPEAAVAIKLLGAIYLIWVGVQLWRSASEDSEAGMTDQAPGLRQGSLRRAFWFGLATNLANPKTAAFAASLFAVALPPDAGNGHAASAVALVCAVSTGWYMLVSVVGSGRMVRAAYGRARAGIVRLTAVVFAGYGLRLIWESADADA
ncbi:MAG: LysE family transporter [Pseudomonadota bacterium]